MTAIRPYLDRFPALGPRVYVDPAATVIGDVELAEDVSVWPGTVIRGDVNHIRIGARTNVQDGTIIHVSHHSPYNRAGYPTLIGADVTVAPSRMQAPMPIRHRSSMVQAWMMVPWPTVTSAPIRVG